MVKNTTGGCKHKKQKNSIQKLTRPLVLKEDSNEGYGQVTTFLGGNMVMVRKLGSQIEFRCRMRKSLAKIKKKDIVLYALREYESKDIGKSIYNYKKPSNYLLSKNIKVENNIMSIEFTRLLNTGNSSDIQIDLKNNKTNIIYAIGDEMNQYIVSMHTEDESFYVNFLEGFIPSEDVVDNEKYYLLRIKNSKSSKIKSTRLQNFQNPPGRFSDFIISYFC